jgi:hypothetical protein
MEHSDAAAMSKTWVWLSGLAALGLLGGLVVCFAVNKTLGGGIAAACGIFCIVAYFMVSSMAAMVTVLAWVAGTVVVVGGVLAVWALWRNRGLLDGLVRRFNYVADKPFSAPAVKEAIKQIGPPGLDSAVAKAKARLKLADPVPLVITPETPATPPP